MRRTQTLVVRGFILVMAAYGVWIWTIEPLRANRAITRIERSTRAAADQPALEAAPVARANIGELKHLQKVEPSSVDIYMLMSINWYILGRNDESIVWLDRALTIDHRPEIYMNRGIAHLESGQIDRAIADIAKAVKFDPAYLNNVDASLHERVRAAAGIK